VIVEMETMMKQMSQMLYYWEGVEMKVMKMEVEWAECLRLKLMTTSLEL
jgi:hypothetical protein